MEPKITGNKKSRLREHPSTYYTMSVIIDAPGHKWVFFGSFLGHLMELFWVVFWQIVRPFSAVRTIQISIGNPVEKGIQNVFMTPV